RLISDVAEDELTPPDLATRSETEELLLPKIFPRSCDPTLSMLLVELPPLNRDETLSTAEPKPPSRIRPARVPAPSRVDTIFVNPLKMVGTAPFKVCRVEGSDSPTSELALRTTSGVR